MGSGIEGLFARLKPFLKRLARSHPELERATRRLFDLRYQIACRHLRGIGVEVGALNHPLYLPRKTHAYYLDRLSPAQLYAHYPEHIGQPFFVSFIADGETMACVRDQSLDFLIANHVIEHCQDPIGALKTFCAKLCAGGKVFMAVPEMTKTFDHKRTETSWEHLLADHQQGPQRSRAQHYREWATEVHGLSGVDAEHFAREQDEIDYSIHFHCWTRAGFAHFIEQLAQIVPFKVVEQRSWRLENIFVLEKH